VGSAAAYSFLLLMSVRQKPSRVLVDHFLARWEEDDTFRAPDLGCSSFFARGSETP
jgi:hypothetical protein